MRKMFEYFIDGKEMVLVTIVSSTGATPRGAGAHMIVTKEGRIWGTIGGGEVEHRAEQLAKQVLVEKNSYGHDFSLAKGDVQNLGMICGGTVHVFFQYIPEQGVPFAKLALKLAEESEDVWMICEVQNGTSLGLYSKKTGFVGIEPMEWLLPYMVRRPKLVKENGREVYVEQVFSSDKVYIFGAGHVAQELVPVLAHVGFRCVVMDDRAEFVNKDVFPMAEQAMVIDYERVADYITVKENDYICVMTRGHASDTSVQAQILKTPASYIGVMGSRAKKAGVYQKLYEMGFTKEDTDRIISPIGLDIKGDTPAEIAISIASQLIYHRAMRKLS